MGKARQIKRTSYSHPREIEYMSNAFRQCESKKPYASERNANQNAQELAVRYGMAFRAYKCQHCSQWHLTSKEQVTRK